MEQMTIRFTPHRSAQEPIAIGAGANGDVIGSTAHHLIRDGKPWYPVMGEFHYSRYPAEEWETELRKMKACGVGIVATYVFWIHHEEERGVWRWDGNLNLNLRRFLLLCQRVGLEVLLRIGPWAHGECRNGGFPDWLQHDPAIALRTDDPAYLALVEALYGRIFEAAEGMLMKDGGPIIGVQLENEYGHCGGESGGKGLVHMRTLKRLAQAAGFLVPLYTATGWGGGNVVDGEMLPVMGGYADAPWDRCLTALPANPNYLMIPASNDPMIASDWQHAGERFTYQVDAYPYLTAELGGGIQCTFHRRPLITADDTAAQAMVKLATGANLLGYYMFHGGTHPIGRTTLQESTATGSWTDVPVRSYDFQAPVGESGALHESFHALRGLHTLVADAGETLADSLCYFPETPVTDAENLTDLRVCVRFDAATREGFLFINNHQRNRHMAAHREVRFVIDAGEERFELPPMHVPAGFYGAIPFNLRCGAHRLRTTNLRLLCRLGDVPVLCQWGREAPRTTFGGGEGKAIILSRREALQAWRVGDALWIADGCLIETPEGLALLTEKSSTVVRRLPDGAEHRLTARRVQPRATLEEVRREEDCAVYRVRLSDLSRAAVEDAHLIITYEGDHAEMYLNGELIADDYAVGRPWRTALKRHGWPRELEVRVYPVKRPTYFEIPQPQGMTATAAKVTPVYRLRVPQ